MLWVIIKFQVTELYLVTGSMVLVGLFGLFLLVKAYEYLFEKNEIGVKSIVQMGVAVLLVVTLNFAVNFFGVADMDQYSEAHMSRELFLQNYSMYSGTIGVSPIFGLVYFLWKLRKSNAKYNK